MTDSQAITELKKIILMKDTKDYFLPGQKRYEALLQWLDKWVDTTTSNQSVINPDKLPAEHSDLLKETLITKMAEKLTNECNYSIMKNSVTATLTVLRRTPKL